jgi:hypothetical protein
VLTWKAQTRTRFNLNRSRDEVLVLLKKMADKKFENYKMNY